ncbi:MAG: hypothetical protein AB2693_13335 [Candidatus Thiodiazotropha sp.]
MSEIKLTKDGLIVQPDERLSFKTDPDLLTLHLKSASIDDGACYSITYNNTDVEEGKILVQVIALETSTQKRYTSQKSGKVLEDSKHFCILFASLYKYC